MCNLSDGIERKGIEIGEEIEKKKNTMQSIQNLMKNLKFSIEQAMTALEIPEIERKKLAKQQKDANRIIHISIF